MQRWLSSSLLVGAILFTALPAGAEVFYKVDFEGGDTAAVVGTSHKELIDGAIDAVANPDPDAANGSSMVGRFRVPVSGSKVRAELSSQRLPTAGETYRYRWSSYVPTDFFDGANINWLANSQWKTWPCEVCNATYDPAICGGCGGIFNEIRILDQQWDFRWRAEPDCHEHSEAIDFGDWTRFEMLVYWTTGSDGYVRLWRGGSLIKSLDSIRTLFTSFESGSCDIYWSLGLYANWTGSKSHLEMFIDDIEISDETGAPDGGVTDAGTQSDGSAAGSSGAGGTGVSGAGGTGVSGAGAGGTGGTGGAGGKSGGASGGEFAANTGSPDDGGCGCEAAGSGSGRQPGALAGLLLASCLWRERGRNRQKVRGSCCSR